MQKTLLIFLCIILVKTSHSQRVLVNSADSIYDINLAAGLCASANAGNYCNPNGQTNFIFSTALRKDTLYFISRNSVLYRMKLGDISTCTVMTTFASNGPGGSTVNSLTVAGDGTLYAADGATRELFHYNPYTNVKTLVGLLNASPAGDLIFYKIKLMMAAVDGAIYEINLNNPSASSVYIPSSTIQFYGLISIPYDCTRNKYYGLEWFGSNTRLYEIDMVNKLILGVECQLPFKVYDGASDVDNGNTLGVTIDSLNIQPACGINNIAAFRAFASTASPGNLSYTLDGTITNNTGVFNVVTEGTHTLSVKNQQNCTTDSVFTILHGLSPVISLNITNPINCNLPNGSINVLANSGFPPLSYSINGGAFTSSPFFSTLTAGTYTISVHDGKGCSKDTSVSLHFQTLPSFLSSINVNPTFCSGKTGSILINLAGGINPADVTASVNGLPQQHVLFFSGLDSGQYMLSVIYQQICRYDTLITVSMLTNQQPAISLDITDQKCLENNGKVIISALGSYGPYRINFNNSGITGNFSYSGLSPGTYLIKVIDKDGCETDTSAKVIPYILLPVQFTTNKTNPTCKQITGGSIIVAVTGQQNPYQLKADNIFYNNGAAINGLAEGTHNIVIINDDGCPADMANVVLKLEVSPECDFIFVPTAFTPNNDGLNDILKPYIGLAVIDFEFRIYNRWGQLVFSTNDRTSGWDGKLNGILQPSSVFTWVISYKTISNPTKQLEKGTLVLIR